MSINDKFLGYEMRWLPNGEWESCDDIGVNMCLLPFVLDTRDRDEPKLSHEEKQVRAKMARDVQARILTRLDNWETLGLPLANSVKYWRAGCDPIEPEAEFRKISA